MSSHRSRRAAGAVDARAAGRRRIVGATTVSAVGGTALAVFFGSLFAQAFAEESAPKTTAPVQAALTLPEKQDSKDSKSAKHTTAPNAPTAPKAAPRPAAGEPVGSSGGS